MNQPASSAWVERYARALDQRSGTEIPTELTAMPAVERLLDMARSVAHGTQRSNAPLATAIAGSYVILRVAQGTEVETALREAAEVASELF